MKAKDIKMKRQNLKFKNSKGDKTSQMQNLWIKPFRDKLFYKDTILN